MVGTLRAPVLGSPGTAKPKRDEERSHFRRTEVESPFNAKSVFQLGGHGAVGTGLCVACHCS